MTEAIAAEVDLTTCDREPIHVPGHVQAPGELISIELDSGRVDAVSAGLEARYGWDARAWVGRSYREALPPELVEIVTQGGRPLGRPGRLHEGKLGRVERAEVLGHAYLGRHLVELLPHDSDAPDIDLFQLGNRVLRYFESDETVRELCDGLAERTRELLGYDRGMVYRFGHDWHGWVYSEARDEALEPFLGLRYPASDIPLQARRLFLSNRTRLIPEVGYTPSRLLGLPGAAPVDLSFAVLRGVSPIHVEYLQNMEVTGTFTMSLLRGGKLWGMVACHHYSGARHLPYEARTAAELVARSAELRLSELLARDELRERERAAALSREITQSLVSEDTLLGALQKIDETLLTSMGATGFVLVEDGTVGLRAGRCPSDERILELVEALSERKGTEVLVSHQLVRDLSVSLTEMDVASGLVAVPISNRALSYLIWFRPELRQLVSWAGRPEKSVTLGPHGPRLRPRGSFEVWKEETKDTSEPWSPAVTEMTAELRNALGDVVFRERGRLMRLAEELRNQRNDMEAFSSMASHDLREPLRGIANYVAFAIEDFEDGKELEVKAHLRAVERLVRRMYALVDGLTDFSKLVSTEITGASVDVHKVLEDVLADLETISSPRSARVAIRGQLPVIRSWTVGLTEIFSNLLSNALKYSDGPPVIEVGVARPDEIPEGLEAEGKVVFFVKDEGIGIAPEYAESIFRIFHRLHGESSKYGEGTGMGLSLVRRMVTRLGGQIVMRPNPAGNGTVFFFSVRPLSNEGSDGE